MKILLSQLSLVSLVFIFLLSGCSGTQSKPEKSEKKRDAKHPPQASVSSNNEALEMLIVEADMHAASVASPQVLHRSKHASIQVTGSRIMHEENTEQYQAVAESSVKQAASEPLSTFSIDVDTGSYTNVRRMLNQGMLPPKNAVRSEEFLNYFDYQYPNPNGHATPFSVSTQLSVAPWRKSRKLLQIGIKGFEPDQDKRKSANLVFLLDVSGSMNAPNKLPLLKRALLMLSKQLTKDDRLSVVVYAGASGVVLENIAGNNTIALKQALDKLSAGGGTHGSAGIELAYQLAQKSFNTKGINRVVLATDGDFNLGTTNHDALIELIENKRKQGIALTTLGFGQGNYNDHLMEQLANKGNGNYAYIDNINEARKVLVDELTANLQVIAKDVKIQVEFNPAVVQEYRLVGYDNRQLAKEDFNNDKVDAGEIGAGHTVTAFYEITLVGDDEHQVDPLKYLSPAINQSKVKADELATIKIRYKAPQGEKSKLISQVVRKDELVSFDNSTQDFKFASTVFAFANILKQSKFAPNADVSQLVDIALAAKGVDTFGYRSEFIQLMRTAQALLPEKVKLAPAEKEQAIELSLQNVQQQLTQELMVTNTRLMQN